MCIRDRNYTLVHEALGQLRESDSVTIPISLNGSLCNEVHHMPSLEQPSCLLCFMSASCQWTCGPTQRWCMLCRAPGFQALATKVTTLRGSKLAEQWDGSGTARLRENADTAQQG
eukprot:3008007-Amphidinium_carterae.1